MEKKFEIALEELYSTFSKYPLNPVISGCCCCVSDSDKSTLHSKKLRELEDDDISKYAFKAMTTWGDVNDFKHYLPRIFELAARRKLIVDTFVVLGKLEYADWDKWEEDERDSILQFLKVWWNLDINNASYFEPEVLIELYKRTLDLPSMLKDWDLDVNTQGFKNYVDLVENYYAELKGEGKKVNFKDFNKPEIEILIDWIEKNSAILEKAFFKYETKDIKLCDRISNTVYIFELFENRKN